MYQVFSKHMLCLLFISLTKIASSIFKNILSIKMAMVSLSMKQKGLSVVVTWVSDCKAKQTAILGQSAVPTLQKITQIGFLIVCTPQ